MAPYSDDEFESDVDEDIVAAEPSEAELPRVSPATKLKPMPRVYQPVYPASPMTIAGGVSPNVSPSPGKSPGTNVFWDDGTRRTRSGSSGEKNEEEANDTASTETSARDAARSVSASRGTLEQEEGSQFTRKEPIEATPSPSPTPTGDKPPRARWIRPDAPGRATDAKRPRETEAAARRARVSARSTNPVEMRRELLARRRREAAANAPRTPAEARAAKGKLLKNARENANEKKQTRADVARDALGAPASVVPTGPITHARVVRADLRSGAPIFSRRAADALEASGARNVLAEDEKASPARTACYVAVAEAGRGGTYLAARGPLSPYAPTPTHRTYAWYKQFGFAGKGAASSWGFNPKRADLFAAYAKASATRENPRRTAEKKGPTRRVSDY